VSLRDLPVVEVVCGRDLHHARAELALDVVIGNDANRAAGQRQCDFLADECRVALVVRIHGDGDVTQHRLRARRRHDEGAASIEERIPDLPEFAGHLLVFHFEVDTAVPSLGSQCTRRLPR
jgi:hypothetical protein